MATTTTLTGCPCCGISSPCCSSGSMASTVYGTFTGDLSSLGSVTFTYNSGATRWEAFVTGGAGCWPYDLIFQLSCQSVGGGAYAWFLIASGFNAPPGVLFVISISTTAPIVCDPLSLTFSGSFSTVGIPSPGCSGTFSVTFTI